LGIFQDSLTTLKMAKTKFQASKDALDQFKEGWENKTTLIPLTSSMYCPGRVKDIDSFIVDIGTGYYVEKDRESAKDYFKRRVDFVGEQLGYVDLGYPFNLTN
jgi:prefoldin alpha subunit